jgi:hypothetical protein
VVLDGAVVDTVVVAGSVRGGAVVGDSVVKPSVVLACDKMLQDQGVRCPGGSLESMPGVQLAMHSAQ